MSQKDRKRPKKTEKDRKRTKKGPDKDIKGPKMTKRTKRTEKRPKKDLQRSRIHKHGPSKGHIRMVSSKYCVMSFEHFFGQLFPNFCTATAIYGL
jgi:hypothetical protein